MKRQTTLLRPISYKNVFATFSVKYYPCERKCSIRKFCFVSTMHCVANDDDDGDDDDDELRFNDASTHEVHLSQDGIWIFFYIETAIIIIITSQVCMKI